MNLAELLREALTLLDAARNQPDDLQGPIDVALDDFRKRAKEALRAAVQPPGSRQ